MDFQFSKKWFAKFVSIAKIKRKRLCGSKQSYDEVAAAIFIECFEEITKGYYEKDVFNCDESALYIKGLSKYSYTLGETNLPRKNSKKMTVLLGCSMEGEKIPLYFIGKSKNPRCFKNFNLKDNNILYGSNKATWMTASLFKDWLTIINDKMKKRDRKIILLLDNASSHKDPKLSNVKLVFFHPILLQ